MITIKIGLSLFQITSKMLDFKTLMVALFFSITVCGQTSVREKDYVITYLGNSIVMDYDSAVFVKAYDVFTNEALTVVVNDSKLNSFVLEGL